MTFVTDPLGESTEITGPIATKLFISSQTTDADIFAVVRVFRPDLSEVVFQGAVDPHTPVAQGWLRASHRKLDPERTTDWRPYHTHDEIQALDPGEIYEVDIEVWPTCVVVPSGYRIALSIRGRDYEYPGASDTAGDSPLGRGFTGVGPFRHEDPRDRPPDIYNGEVTIYSGPEQPSHLLLPIVPGV